MPYYGGFAGAGGPCPPCDPEYNKHMADGMVSFYEGRKKELKRQHAKGIDVSTQTLSWCSKGRFHLCELCPLKDDEYSCEQHRKRG